MSNTKVVMSQASNQYVAPTFIEDVFSTYLYTGTGTTPQTITNGIDLAGEGGLVWTKSRTTLGHVFCDTGQGIGKYLSSNQTWGTVTNANVVNAFNSDGYSIGSEGDVNANTYKFASWTFRKPPRFFDVVTYTGTGSAQTIAHNLGTTVGSMIIKRTDTSGSWVVYHRGLNSGINAEQYFIFLNATTPQEQSTVVWNDTAPTDSVFTVGTNVSTLNASGGTYVAYLYAHDPLGPSGDGSDGLIACGSYTGNGSSNGPEINLGWEPQWLLVKNASAIESWYMFDVMRGMPVGGDTKDLYPNSSAAEDAFEGAKNLVDPTPTGFKVKDSGALMNGSGQTIIYIAIRRGPMRAPESGTEVFAVDNGGGGGFASGFPVDSAWTKNKDSAVEWKWYDRLRGHGSYLRSNLTNAETSASSGESFASNTEFDYGLGADNIGYIFRRAPGFFDVVAYTGDNVAGRTISHNLGVAPEMMIVKKRSEATDWNVYHSGLGPTKTIWLNQTSTGNTHPDYWYNTAPTSSVFSVGGGNPNNYTTRTYIAYLFATLAGVSKVGSYTGNGTSQTIDCGFTTGARLVLIKATSTTGDWLIADTARGIVAGNDPYLELNTTNAEVTSGDWLDPDSSGFVVNEVAGSNANTSGVSYIFYAVA